MPQHFNAPPGWPVPLGWQPPPDWEPDPSWPPAPAGWRFWVDDVSDQVAADEHSQPSPNRGVGIDRRIVIASAAAVLVIALVVATVAAVLWWTKRENSAAVADRPEYLLPGTYPSAPQPAWTVNATELSNDAAAKFIDPAFDLGSPYNGAIIGDGHIVSLVDGKLLSLNLSDGKTEWSVPGAGLQCAHDLLGNTLPCITSSDARQHAAVHHLQ